MDASNSDSGTDPDMPMLVPAEAPQWTKEELKMLADFEEEKAQKIADHKHRCKQEAAKAAERAKFMGASSSSSQWDSKNSWWWYYNNWWCDQQWPSSWHAHNWKSDRWSWGQ